MMKQLKSLRLQLLLPVLAMTLFIVIMLSALVLPRSRTVPPLCQGCSRP